MAHITSAHTSTENSWIHLDSLESEEKSDDFDVQSWVSIRSDDEDEREFEEPQVYETKSYCASGQTRLDCGRQNNKTLIPRRAGRNSGKIEKRTNLTSMPSRKMGHAYRRWERLKDGWIVKKAFGTFKCQVCLSKWSSSLAWAKKTDAGRIGYRYGQICKSIGCEGSGHRIYVRPYDLIFYDDPDASDRLAKKSAVRKKNIHGDHIAENCEMCILLGGGRKCFHFNRNARFQEANEASAAYNFKHEPDLPRDDE